MSRPLLVAACALVLAGCDYQSAVHNDPAHHFYQAEAILLGADVVSVINTGKTIDDHLIGIATDQDCSTVRASQGGPWCKPIPIPVATVAQTAYCYKSLASVSCYVAPLPFDSARYIGSRTEQVPAP